jgi:uncharacterized Fe-S cluster-containing radical SAM superfamily enzyme
MAARQVHECALCAYQCSVTAGTIWDESKSDFAVEAGLIEVVVGASSRDMDMRLREEVQISS